MRATRIISFMAAFALLAFLPFVSSTASAATSDAVAVGSSSERAAATRVSARIIEKRRTGNLIMRGTVKPPRGPVTIQKATRCNRRGTDCNFKFYDKVRVNQQGVYSLRVFAPARGNWFWRAKVGKATSSVWITCKTTSGSCV